MATAVAEEMQGKTKAAALKTEKALKELLGDFGNRYWKIAKLIEEVVDKNLWQILGYETRNHYRLYLKIGRATWHRYLRLYQNFTKQALEKDLVTWKSLERLTLENADHLCRLPEKKRFADSWIQKAMTMNEEEFEAAVDSALGVEGEEPDVESTEGHAVIKLHCTTGQKTVILDAIHEFATMHGIPRDEEARSLELLLAEIRNCTSCWATPAA